MLDLSFGTTSRVAAAALIGTVLALSASLPTPAHAASMKKVLEACARTAGCTWDTSGTTITGCSPHACFSCNGNTGQCKPTRHIVSTRPPTRVGVGGTAAASRNVSSNASNQPVAHANGDTMRRSGKH